MAVLVVAFAGLFAFVRYQMYQVRAVTPPAFTEIATYPAQTPAGQATTLGSLVRPGRPTLLVMWASWCGPCKNEGPQILDLRRRYGPDRLNIAYVNLRVGDPQPIEERNRFIASAGLSALPYVSIDRLAYDKITRIKMVGIPRSYLFDRTGKPIKGWVGLSSSNDRDTNAQVAIAVGY
ncbi:MAG: hypothetical protein NVSMB69_09640 [Novosphingobium sp.]